MRVVSRKLRIELATRINQQSGTGEVGHVGVCLARNHAEASLSEGFQDGDTIECPMHSGCFNIRTGEALGAPVVDNIKTYQVRLEGDDVLVRVD